MKDTALVILILIGVAWSDTFTEPKTGMEFVRISKGTFMMGSPESEAQRGGDEGQRQASVPKDFWMGRTEVTQEQWARIMGSNPSTFNQCGLRCPVENVTWFDAQRFLNQLGPGYRLPTETEWEYACRAGTTTAFNTGENLTNKQARFDVDDGPVPVGSFLPNAWGLFDMHGNVWEWTSDWYDDTHAKRVIRGGSWYFGADSARCALRYNHSPDDRGFSLGFRVVKTIED